MPELLLGRRLGRRASNEPGQHRGTLCWHTYQLYAGEHPGRDHSLQKSRNPTSMGGFPLYTAGEPRGMASRFVANGCHVSQLPPDDHRAGARKL
ncbi:hypothetical protein CJF30_00004443 [Rutstroemia sp. NJR-2017a BBW]|nr:hypothetical protein CJF30_00004443 [Rutstroemia sp. NJR-2017a BBW]